MALEYEPPTLARHSCFCAAQTGRKLCKAVAAFRVRGSQPHRFDDRYGGRRTLLAPRSPLRWKVANEVRRKNGNITHIADIDIPVSAARSGAHAVFAVPRAWLRTLKYVAFRRQNPGAINLEIRCSRVPHENVPPPSRGKSRERRRLLHPVHTGFMERRPCPSHRPQRLRSSSHHSAATSPIRITSFDMVPYAVNYAPWCLPRLMGRYLSPASPVLGSAVCRHHTIPTRIHSSYRQ